MKNWWRNRGLLLVALMAAVGLARGQEPVRITDAHFEPQQVLLGDHFDLVMEVEAQEGFAVAFPDLAEGFAEGRIELLNEGGVDTVFHREGRYGLRKRYKLTSFEPSNYMLDSLGVLSVSPEGKVDTLMQQVGLVASVAMIPIDTTQTTIYDIKRPMKAPIYFGEFSGYLLWTVLALAAVAGLVYLIVRRLAGRGLGGERAKPSEPPHIVAIRRLESLHNQKLWQNGRLKEYYSLLTDILRDYLDGRFGVSAMEMTSEEIIVALRGLDIMPKQYEALSRLLRESDLVKFAKYVPEQEYHEEAYLAVYYFVEESKQVAVEEMSQTKAEEKNESE
ncbi:MAG: hypothetical protein J6R74_00970 [Tidjanibacter sp.]|nr:hypothetical protein [Tidjanibacter sp.]